MKERNQMPTSYDPNPGAGPIESRERSLVLERGVANNSLKCRPTVSNLHECPKKRCYGNSWWHCTLSTSQHVFPDKAPSPPLSHWSLESTLIFNFTYILWQYRKNIYTNIPIYVPQKPAIHTYDHAISQVLFEPPERRYIAIYIYPETTINTPSSWHHLCFVGSRSNIRD